MERIKIAFNNSDQEEQKDDLVFLLLLFIFGYYATLNRIFQKPANQLIAAITCLCGNIVDFFNQIFSYPYRKSFEAIFPFCTLWGYD